MRPFVFVFNKSVSENLTANIPEIESMVMNRKLLAFLIILLGSCGDRKLDPKEFIKSVQDKDLAILFDNAIQARGKRDGKFHYYYIHVFCGDDTLAIPSNEYFDDSYVRDSTSYHESFKKLAKCKGLDPAFPVASAKAYALKLDGIYHSLKVINIISLPKPGRFIQFLLRPDCTVYYLEDAATLEPYWKGKFGKLDKIGTKWYCNCK